MGGLTINRGRGQTTDITNITDIPTCRHIPLSSFNLIKRYDGVAIAIRKIVKNGRVPQIIHCENSFIRPAQQRVFFLIPEVFHDKGTDQKPEKSSR